ncbi:hypothetical protein [Cellulosimicrobium funkei]|uniref:hypothetical protein n=1 Tax=Cellulosimicrobium funkei TaxID=264251 RepID=UPI00342784B4
MALIVLASANGSPGVTTAALGLALSWHRPVVLVDADPTGAMGIPAGYLRGGQLPTDATILDLAIALRQGNLAEELPRSLIQLPDSQVQFLCGTMRHNQARALDELWEPFAAVAKALERNGQDMIVDAGRLGLEGSPYRLFAAADLGLLVTRSNLPSLVAASSWAPTLRETFERVGARESLGALVVGPGRPYGQGEVAKVLSMPVVASLAWDPDTARVYSDGEKPGRKFASSGLNKSLRATVHAIQSVVAAGQKSLGLAQERN